MPLLKKPVKGGLSQTNNIASKHFKTPLNHKSRIKTIIDDPLPKSNSRQIAYESFTNKLSQKDRSSSPKVDYNENNIHKDIEIPNKIKENRNVKDKNLNLNRKLPLGANASSQKEFRDHIKTNHKMKKNSDVCLTTQGSFSQEDLNKDVTKSAYVEFMNKALSREEKKNRKDKTLKRELSPSTEESTSQAGLKKDKTRLTEEPMSREKKQKKAKNLERKLSLSTNESMSQDLLNSSGIKDAYIDFMNKSLANESRKRDRFIVYSSSEDLFNEIVDISPSVSAKPTKSPKKIILYKSDDPLDKSIEKILGDGLCKSNSNEQSTSRQLNDPVDTNKGAKIYKSRSKQESGSSKSKINLISEDKVAKKRSTSRNQKTKETTKQELPPKEKSGNKKHRNGNSENQSDNKTTKENKFNSEFSHLTPEQKMEKLYQARNTGLYAYCDTCNKARYLAHVVDPLDLPDKWFCYMNPDKKYNKCSVPESVEEDEDFLVHNSYNAGSIVFAKMQGYPWWPAMVEDDPDYQQYFWLKDSMEPTDYHVTFFDSGEVSRAWMKTDKLAPFKKNLNNPEYQIPPRYKLKKRLSAAFEQASEAVNMPLIERLKTYGFLKRYKAPTKRSTKSKKNVPNKRKQNEEKKQQVRRASTSSFADSSISDILGNVNLQDLSFNFLD